ncbi:hypothetical protein ACOSQ4_024427 [Xanthoceras sorbifolium]
MKKHFASLKKNIFFHLLLLNLSSSSVPRFNQFLAIWHPLMIMMKISLFLSVSQIKTTTLRPVLLFSLLKSF